MDRVAKEKEYEDIYKGNLEQTLNDIEAVQQEMGLSDEQVDAAMAHLQKIVSDGVMGKFSPESIKMALKAISHDEDVALAAHEGEVKGRNTKIEEKLRKEKKGDGMPTINSKNNNVAQARRGSSIFDIAREAK
jgi:predicted DNA-binding ArsR family transcriptional regulator